MCQENRAPNGAAKTSKGRTVYKHFVPSGTNSNSLVIEAVSSARSCAQHETLLEFKVH